MADLPFRLRAFADSIFAKIGSTSTADRAYTDTQIAGIPSGLAIDDTTPSTSDVFSSSETITRITNAIANALEGEDLSDIADAIAANAAAHSDLVTLATHNALAAIVSNKANSSDHYTKTEQGNPDYDIAAYFDGL